MNRREFCQKSSTFLGTLPLGTSLLALASPALADPAPATNAAPANPQPAATLSSSPPVLQNPSGDGSLTIVWGVSSVSTGWIEYGETEALGQTEYGDSEGLMAVSDKVLKIRLTNLKPGTKYFYRVVTASAQKLTRGVPMPGPVYQFKTLDAKATSTSFSLINDTHENKETLTRLVGMIQAQPTDSLIWDGDIFNWIGSEQNIIDSVLNPAGLAYATNIPLVLVKGNHDVRGWKARLLDKYTDVPNGRWYYTFRQGPVAFVVLDTGEDKPDTSPNLGGLTYFERYRTVQQEWLRRAVQNPEFRDAPFRVALLHIPIIWKNYAQRGWYCHDGKDKWHDVFVQGKIDLVISGHTHEHAWFPPGGEAPYAQLIGGGPSPKSATLIRGQADQDKLSFTMCDLNGKELASHTFNRQA